MKLKADSLKLKKPKEDNDKNYLKYKTNKSLYQF